MVAQRVRVESRAQEKMQLLGLRGAAEGCGSMGRAKGHPSLAVCDSAGNGGSRGRQALAERVFFFFLGCPCPMRIAGCPSKRHCREQCGSGVKAAAEEAKDAHRALAAGTTPAACHLASSPFHCCFCHPRVPRLGFHLYLTAYGACYTRHPPSSGHRQAGAQLTG